MKSKKQQIQDLILEIQASNIYYLIGASLHTSGFTELSFRDTMKKNEVGTGSPFGNNVQNALRDCEKGSKVYTLEDFQKAFAKLQKLLEENKSE